MRMIVNINEASKQPGTPQAIKLSGALPPLTLGEETYPHEREAVVTGTLTALNDRVTVNFNASAIVVFSCARCLRSVSVELSADYAEIFLKEPDAYATEYVKYEGMNIDITDSVVAALELSLPMKALCADDCAGIDPSESKPEAIESEKQTNPFSVLSELKFTDTEEQ